MLDYLEQQWFTSHDTWYEAYVPFVPSTNNALEASNKVIKDEHTLRERQTISIFKENLKKMIRLIY